MATWLIIGVAAGIAYGWFSGNIVRGMLIGLFVGAIVAFFGKKPGPGK
ncbi:MAG: hypothetical protein HKN92_08220 [Chitinophagales bacterium]|nr:hypothetical protein [Chitinophagales bacterium]